MELAGWRVMLKPLARITTDGRLLASEARRVECQGVLRVAKNAAMACDVARTGVGWTLRVWTPWPHLMVVVAHVM